MSEPASTPVRIQVVDDEPQIRRFLDISLRAQGYQVDLAENGRQGLEQIALHQPDLVVLDIGLPDMDGHAVLHELRQWSTVPVIMLTVRSGEAEKVAALDGGANDYVTKPFGTEELMARIRTLLRARVRQDGDAGTFDDGHLHIDPAKREVRVAGELITLTRKEYALLQLLARNPGRVITQPQILREVWGVSHEHDTHYIRILVAKLRQKIGDDAVAPRYIVTEPGVGLKLVALADAALKPERSA
jgi:two-component system KDP operon response regulator KdpE